MAEKPDDARIVTRPERNAATSQRDNAAGGPKDPAHAGSARPNDLPIREHEWALPNSTLAERAKAAAKRGAKKVDADDTEDKAVSKATTKGRRKS